MRVMEIIHLEPNKFGSFEKYSLGFGVYLRDKGHEHIACYRGNACSALQDEMDRVGGTIYDQYFDNLGVINSIVLLRFIRKHKIDVVHFHFYPIYSFFSFISKFIPCKVFFSYRISGEFSSNTIWVTMLKKIRSKLSGLGINGVFCVSDFARRKFINNFHADPKKALVVHNGLNWNYFPDIERSADSAEIKQFRIICVAALIKDKGITDLLEAVLKIKDKVPGMYLNIVGSGADRVEFETFVHASGLESFVSFLGSRDDVPALLGESDVAVIPSRWGEAFGFTVIEAMAAKLPVIATTVGGIPEIIDHEKTGLLVQKAEPDEIADALLRLYRDESFRSSLGYHASMRVKDYFNVNRVYDQQLGYYTNLP